MKISRKSLPLLKLYKKDFPKIEQDEARLEKLKETYTEIPEQMDDLAENDMLSEFSCPAIRDMTNKVAANPVKNYQSINERISELTGGHVLDFEAKRIRDNARAEGIEQGIEQGRKQGVKQGIEQGSLQERRFIVTNMFHRGKTPEEIAEFSGIPLDEILSIIE